MNERSAWFRIGETLVAESKSEITPEQAIEKIRVLIQRMEKPEAPSAQPPYNPDEWCTDCKEYDQEQHSCPRWNRVIRKTVDELRAEQAERREG